MLGLTFMNYSNYMTIQKNKIPKAGSYFYDLMLRYLLTKQTPIIGVRQLQELAEKPLLLDIREEGEYSVSHLPNAINPGSNNFNTASLSHIPKKNPIVAYCSVGYRSEKAVIKLRNNGFKNVYNLYGGIFEWKNSGYPVFDDQGVTEKIHTYNRAWGIWLSEGYKVY